MALVNCPKCGNSVSDTVKKCIHCGCDITVCPECKSVFEGNIDVCSTCGYEFKPSQSRSTEPKGPYEHGDKSLITLVKNTKEKYARYQGFNISIQRMWLLISVALFLLVFVPTVYVLFPLFEQLVIPIFSLFVPAIIGGNKTALLGSFAPFFCILLAAIPIFLTLSLLLHAPSIINRALIIKDVMRQGYNLKETIAHLNGDADNLTHNKSRDLIDVFFVRAFFNNKFLMILIELFLNSDTLIGTVGTIGLVAGALISSIICPILNFSLDIAAIILPFSLPDPLRFIAFVAVYIIFIFVFVLKVTPIVTSRIIIYISQKSGKLLRDEKLEKKDDSSNNQNFQRGSSNTAGASVDVLAERIKLYGIIGITIGIVQLLTFVFSIVGIINIIVGIRNLNLSKKLQTHYVGLVKVYKPIVKPLITLVLNLIFGGIIGIFLSIYYLFAIRGYVMEHKDYFNSLN